MVLIDTGGGGGSPKKKKKKSPPKVVGGTHFSHTKAPVHYSSYTLPKTFHHTSSYSPANTYSRPTPSYTPTYRRPTYSSAPSYSRIVRPPKPKPPTPFEILDSLGLGFAKEAKDKDYTAFKGITRDDNQDEVKAGIFGDFISGVNTGGNSHEPQGDALSQLLMNPLRGKKPQEMYGETPESELSPGMRKFLDSLRGTDKAAPGTVPGMDKMGQNDFAWVPEKFKHLKNGRLKSQWDDQFINSSRGDFAFPSQFEAFLNDMMEAQFRDREKWLLGRNERKYNKIKEVLDDAGQAAFKGDFNFLEREHPNFDPSIPTYRSQFGITPEQITDDWQKRKKNITDPYMMGSMRSRMDSMREHYEKLRSGTFFSFQETQNLVDRAIKKYETRYNDSVEFALDGHDDARKAAAKQAGPAIPTGGRDNKDQRYADKAGAAYDPSDRGAFSEWYNPDDTKRGKKLDRRAVAEARRNAMHRLGTHKLPSVKQMITYAVANGDLDPNNEDEVEKAIDRFKNPNHPDTRAMYVSYTASRNPEFDVKGEGLKFINDPVVNYAKQQEQLAKEKQIRQIENDKLEIDGPFDFVSDLWKANPTIGKGIPLQDVRPTGGGQGVTATEGNEGLANWTQLGWTFDKLTRLNYGVAGAANAWYGMDKDKPNLSWVERILDPVSNITGKPFIDSMDEILKDPSGLKKVTNEAYQQVFRGSNLPGIKDNIIPITFSHVIANQAMRDTENNIYDKSWYQHVAGFGLDVALDPLNYIGIGLVDDALKVPVRVAKALKAAEKGDEPTIEIMQFLNKVEDRSRSPLAEKVYRTDQAIRRIGDDVSGKDYVDDADLWSPDYVRTNEFDHDTVVHVINNQLDDLAVQETKLKNDMGIEAMNDELRHITDQMDTLAFRSKVDFRFNRIAKRTEISINGTDLKNPGGMFWRDYLDPLEKGAFSKGYFDVEYAPTSIGKAAKRAESDLNKLLDDIDLGKVHEADPAVAKRKAELEHTIDRAYAVDEATGKPSVKKIPRIEEYRKSKEYQRPRLDPAKELAAAAGMSKEDFARHFTDEDVHKALTLGPRMLVESDETAARMLADANERIHYAKEQLNNPKITEAKRNAVQRALAAGYQMQSNVTIEGMLRYLDTLQDMKRTGGLVSVKNAEITDKVNHLEEVDSRVMAELEKHPQYEDTASGYIGSQSMDLRDRKFEGTDFFDESTLDDLMASGGKSTVEDLAAIHREIRTQIDELLPELRSTGEVTGFPPAQAHQVERMVPSDSVFRNKAGEIDGAKVAEHLEFNYKTHEIRYKAPEGATPQEIGFLDLVAETVRAEYHGAYRAVKSEIIRKRNAGKSTTDDAPAVGKHEAALGPRPTAKSLRERYPEIFARNVKGDTPKGPLPKGFHVDEAVEFQGGVKGVPGDFVRKAPKVVETGGKRSKSQKVLDEFIERKQKEWDKRIVRARERDAGEARRSEPTFKVTQKERDLIAHKAYKRSVDGVTESLKAGKIKRIPGNMRLTINEHAKQLIETLNLQHKADLAQLKLEELNAKSADEIKIINSKRAALEKRKKDYISEIEAARKTAYETKKNMERIIKDEHALQIANMPVRATGRMLQFRLMGMRKNVQFTNNIFRGAEKAAELVPAKFRENFANYFVRPTKQLETDEAIMFRAMWESKTPVIIKAHLERLSRKMRDIPEQERIAMMKAYRDNVPYEGPHMQLMDDAMSEVKGIEDIWNGTDSFYHLKPKRGEIDPEVIHPHEIYRFLPSDYQPSMKVLYRSMDQDGKITAQNLLESIKANGGKVQDLLDPFRFAWTMRLAADQARQFKALTHSIETTFGVKLPPEKYAFGNKLHATGWSSIKGFDSDTLFPPEAMHDISKLMELTEPGKAQNEFTKLADNALGYWKQSMTIYNPGYYTRNGVGEMMVSWLDGVSHPKWYRMAYRVHRYVKREDQNLARLVEKWSSLDGKIPVDVAKGGELLFKLKGGQKVTIDDALRAYVNMGLKSTFANTDLGQGLRGLSGSALHDSKIRKGLSKVNSSVHEAGEGFEDYLRMAHFLHAMEHSGKGTIHQAAMYAAKRVTRSHFDYSDFSTFEKSVMLRAFPFYKWTRRGAPLMFAHLFMTPGKMSVLPKAMDTMSGLGLDLNPINAVQAGSDALFGTDFSDDPVLSTKDVHDDKNGHLPDYQGIAPGWVRDLFAYQVSPAEDDEYGNYFRLQTPQVDGLNSVLNAIPVGDTDLSESFAQSGAYPLLNPVVKGAIELGTNQSMDPSFPYPIVGGEYNEMNGINPLEAITGYVARSASPVAGFLAKLSKNGDLGPLSMGDGSYRDEHGYNTSRDIASFVTGMGFYQGTHQDTPVVPGSGNDSPVGSYKLSDLPSINGRKAAADYTDRPYKKSNAYDTVGGNGYGGNGWVNYPQGNGWIDYPDWRSNWVDFPNWKSNWVDYGNGNGWVDYGSGGYGGGGGYSGGGGGGGSVGSVSSSGSGTEFWDLIQKLRKMLAQIDGKE